MQVSVKSRIFASRNKGNWIMTTITLDQENQQLLGDDKRSQ